MPPTEFHHKTGVIHRRMLISGFFVVVAGAYVAFSGVPLLHWSALVCLLVLAIHTYKLARDVAVLRSREGRRSSSMTTACAMRISRER